MPTDQSEQHRLTEDKVHRYFKDKSKGPLKINWNSIDWHTLDKMGSRFYIRARPQRGALPSEEPVWVPLRYVRFWSYTGSTERPTTAIINAKLQELKASGGLWTEAVDRVMREDPPDVEANTRPYTSAASPPTSPIQYPTLPQASSSSSSAPPLAKGKTKIIKLPSAGTDAEDLIKAAGDMAYPGIVDSSPGPSSTLTKTEKARKDAHDTNERDQGRAGTSIALSDSVVINYPHGQGPSDLPPGPTKTNVHRYYKPGGVPVKPEATNRAFEAYKRWGGKYNTPYLSYL